MDLLGVAPEPTDPARLRIEAARTCDRLRTMSLVRLAASRLDGRSRAREAVELAQLCADEAAGLAGWPHRRLPEVADAMAGDVLATCAQDLVEQLEARPVESAAEVCATVVARMVALRRTL